MSFTAVMNVYGIITQGDGSSGYVTLYYVMYIVGETGEWATATMNDGHTARVRYTSYSLLICVAYFQLGPVSVVAGRYHNMLDLA